MLKLNNNLLQIFLILRGFSEKNYLVGGSVRDALLGKEPKDFDIVTDVHMDTIEQAFIENEIGRAHV